MLDLQAAYALDEGGLEWSVTAVNAGERPAPWGTSVHPYLVAGPGRVDDWTFELDAAEVLDVDPQRLLPDREGPSTSPVAGTDLDFRAPRPLAVAAAGRGAGTGCGRATSRPGN